MSKDMNKKVSEDDVIDLSEVTGWIQKYDYLPYTFHRIKRILKEYFGVHLYPIGGYKCNRVPNYHQHYWVVSDETNEILIEDVTLDSLRYFFAGMNIPLLDEHSAGQKSNRNPGAARFMEITAQSEQKNRS